MPRRFLFYSNVLVQLLPEEDYARYLEALAEDLPIEVVATDPQGRVIVWNRALAAVAGPREEAVGRPLLQALPWLAADLNLSWGELLHEMLAGGVGRVFGRHPLGDRVVRATIGPMRGEEGRILGTVLSFEDITTGAREQEQRRLTERRTALHDLGASLAHELRNPLNALSLNLQVLNEDLAAGELSLDRIRDRTARMLEDSKRLEEVVTHLLEVSRSDKLELQSGTVDPVVARVVERLDGLARHNGCVINFEGHSYRRLLLDEARFERAIGNIVRNAIEAAAEGGRRVWVSTRDDPASTVIVVDDDGPGIRAEDRSNVFLIYRTGKRGGTGLGLPLAREEIRRHGGEIEALPRPGGGARFVVHLPIEAAGAGERPDVREV